MQDTPILKIPMIAPGQAQKHVTHNEAMMMLDVLLHLSVISRDTLQAPSNPNEGDRYIVGAGGIDAWIGHDSDIAIFRDGAWVFFTPLDGWCAYIETDKEQVCWNGMAWAMPEGGTPSYDRLAVNTGLDANAHLSVQSTTILFSHDTTSGTGTGSLQTVLNKNTPADTASVLFQTNWVGHVELGLNGSNDFSLKTSPNGTSWSEAMVAESASANLRVPERLLIGDGEHRGNGLTISKANPSFYLQDTSGIDAAHSGVVSWVDGGGAEKAWCGLGSNSNSQFSFLTKYTDGLKFITYGGSFPIEFAQHNNIRMRIHTNGNIGIHEPEPTAPLHVNGAVRVGNVTVATLPSAASSGAGAIIYVSDETGGATLAFSDGTNWLRSQDRAVVS